MLDNFVRDSVGTELYLSVQQLVRHPITIAMISVLIVPVHFLSRAGGEERTFN